MRTIAIARIAHEAGRALQVEQGDPTIPVSEPWDIISNEMQDSIEQGVIGVLAGNTPEQSHASWVQFKEEHGWVLGPLKDESLKQHPLMLPYEALPPEAKLKDELFVAIVNALKEPE